MKLTCLFALASLLVASPLQAQTMPDSYTVRYYTAGTSAAKVPLQTETFPAASATILCGQTPIPAGTTAVNPGRISWDETNVVGKACIYPLPTTSPMFALASGNYEATISVTDAAGSSPESAPSPFTRATVRPAPTGFRVVR